MNLDNMDGKMMDDLASDYLTGMYESQYDDEVSFTCCNVQVNAKSGTEVRCKACGEMCTTQNG